MVNLGKVSLIATRDETSAKNAQTQVQRQSPTGAEKQYPLAPSLVASRHYTDEDQYELELEQILLGVGRA